MSTFADLWPTLPIPAEYDAMDAVDQERWRAVVELAFGAGEASERKWCAQHCGEIVRLRTLLAPERELASARIRGALS